MMHHSQIVQRVFNTPPMADPTKALAFLTGLGARITGRVISIDGLEVAAEEQANPTLPARASLFGDELTSHQARNGGHAHPCWRPQGQCQSPYQSLNKAARNDAAFAFKTGFSARALIGLLGSDDFSFKVSPDGSVYFDALQIDRSSGQMELPQPTVLPGLGAAPTPPPAGKRAAAQARRGSTSCAPPAATSPCSRISG